MRLSKIDPWMRRTAAFAASIAYLSLDLYEEFTQGGAYDEQGLLALHHWLEIGVIALVFWCIWCEIRSADRARGQLAEEQERRRRLSEDLAGHIGGRFLEWRLTEAETDIAWLLIKGFSFSEIAELRGVKEKTLRQQATQIYAKSGAKGRAELSAAFLEDLIGGAAVSVRG